MAAKTVIVDRRKDYYLKRPHAKDPKGVANFAARYNRGVRIQAALRQLRRASAMGLSGPRTFTLKSGGTVTFYSASDIRKPK